MAVKAENSSEATLFPRRGMVQEVSATYQITLSGSELRRLRAYGDLKGVLEQCIFDFLLRGGALP